MHTDSSVSAIEMHQIQMHSQGNNDVNYKLQIKSSEVGQNHGQSLSSNDSAGSTMKAKSSCSLYAAAQASAVLALSSVKFQRLIKYLMLII